jgi:putative flavoprotein involved in K+ transport
VSSDPCRLGGHAPGGDVPAHAQPDAGQLAAVRQWLARFAEALRAPDAQALAPLFEERCHWRNLCGLGFGLRTRSGRDAVCDALHARALKWEFTQPRLHPRHGPPRLADCAGEPVLQFTIAFRSRAGEGVGVVRLADPAAASPRAWTLMTALSSLRAGDDVAPGRAGADDDASAGTIARTAESAGDRDRPNWLDRREAQRAFAHRDPEVLVVGGGHAGICAAAELRQQGVDTLIVDRAQRIGDSWRLRYHALKLHNRTPINHMPYRPFPATFPAYSTKDQIANWLEHCVEIMELNFWTDCALEQARHDADTGTWQATLRRGDGSTRTLRPRHIVMATSVSAVPHRPHIATLEDFDGEVLHSSEYRDGQRWRGRPVVVLGTGTSAHDVALDLHAHGAEVRMVQRSPTMVVNIDPSAQLYDALYLQDTPSLEEKDLWNSSLPFPVVKRIHQGITARVREIDAPLLQGLERAGFRLEFGEDDSGWPLKYRQRGGGYYFNAGCSDRIAAGEIRVLQLADIEAFRAGGLRMHDGSEVPAELVVLATGFKGQHHLLRELLGAEVAQRVGEVWGLDPATWELRNMWTRTPQPGLWFTGGAFSQCRIYSRYLALQIRAEALGLASVGREELAPGASAAERHAAPSPA